MPGEFRSLSEALGCDQVAVTLIRIPPHSDFEQGTGHRHEEIEEVYLVTKGTLTMRFDDEIRKVGPGTAVRVAPQTVRSHRNEGDEPVELWAISFVNDRDRGEKVENFWEASPQAAQHRLSRGPQRFDISIKASARDVIREGEMPIPLASPSTVL